MGEKFPEFGLEKVERKLAAQCGLDTRNLETHDFSIICPQTLEITNPKHDKHKK